MIWDHKFSGKTIPIKSISSYFFQIFRQNQISCKTATLECIIRNCFQICTQFQNSSKTCAVIKCVFPNLSYTVRNHQRSAKTLATIECIFPDLCQIVPETQSSFTALKSTTVLKTVFSNFFQTGWKRHTFQRRTSCECIITYLCDFLRQSHFFEFSVILKSSCSNLSYTFRYTRFLFISCVSSQNSVLYEIILSSFFYDSCSIAQTRAISFCVYFITTGRYMDLFQVFHSISSEEIILSTAVQFDLRRCFSFKSQLLYSLTIRKCLWGYICYRTRDFYFF